MKRLFLLFAVLVFASCKTKQAAVTSVNAAPTDKQAQEIVNHHLASFPAFKTLSGNLQVTFDDGKNQQSLPFSFRMEKDKVIWISAPLGIAKMMATPEKVQYYNRLDSTFFDGDFSYLSTLLGVEIGFNELQNLLLGNALYPFPSTPQQGYIHLLPEDNQRYNLKIEDSTPIEVRYSLLPDSYRVETTEVRHIGSSQKAVATYTYQQVQDILLPLTLLITASQGDDSTQIGMELKGVSLDKDLSFPFKIPSGLKEITLK